MRIAIRFAPFARATARTAVRPPDPRRERRIGDRAPRGISPSASQTRRWKGVPPGASGTAPGQPAKYARSQASAASVAAVRPSPEIPLRLPPQRRDLAGQRPPVGELQKVQRPRIRHRDHGAERRRDPVRPEPRRRGEGFRAPVPCSRAKAARKALGLSNPASICASITRPPRASARPALGEPPHPRHLEERHPRRPTERPPHRRGVVAQRHEIVLPPPPPRIGLDRRQKRGHQRPLRPSGRHLRQGRYPASRQAAGVGKKAQFSRRGFRAGQVSRQKMPVVATPTKAAPSQAGSRAMSAS
jgi:hypothetical protein